MAVELCQAELVAAILIHFWCTCACSSIATSTFAGMFKLDTEISTFHTPLRHALEDLNQEPEQEQWNGVPEDPIVARKLKAGLAL